jgi:hypothetical protein
MSGDGERHGGRDLRKILTGSACLIALFVSACAHTDATISRVEGSEPQRLSFGKPEAVEQAFAEQMKACWFNGPSALLAGYQYDTKPSTLETGTGLTELPQVTITSGSGPKAQAFIVQFYPFNENTLISTRNVSFPTELAARLKRDVETWIFGQQAQCDDAARHGGAIASGPLPQISSSVVQQASAGGWSTSQESGGPAAAGTY